ncbi:MAG: hypothetical protein WC464_04365 [Bdellovibrionales bacterium]
MIRSYSSLLLWLCLTIGASLMLYHTSDKVHGLDKQLHALNTQIEDEQRALHVLKAEWVYLANPARIEAKAKRHLSLKPTEPRRIADMQNLKGLLPLQDGMTEAPTMLAEAKPDATSAAKAAKKPSFAQVLAKKTPEAPLSKHDRILASLNAGRINDRVTIQRASATEVKPDRLDSIIRKLSIRP